jgi:RHS repeat-associated protein
LRFTGTFTVSGDQLVVRRTINGNTAQVEWNVAAALPQELTDGGTNYIYGPGGVPVEQITGSGSVLYYLHDQAGSTRALTTQAAAVAATFTYAPYGQLLASTGTATTPFMWQGQYRDAADGLYYLRARYYDPATATFLTRDPLEDLTGEPYTYAGEDPLDGSDPSGMMPLNPTDDSPTTQQSSEPPWV